MHMHNIGGFVGEKFQVDVIRTGLVNFFLFSYVVWIFYYFGRCTDAIVGYSTEQHIATAPHKVFKLTCV